MGIPHHAHPTELPSATLKRLVQILVTRARIDTTPQRLGFLEEAGLESLQNTISVEGDKKTFAQDLIRECRRVGQLPPQNIPAYDLLLAHLQDVASGHPKEVDFLRSLTSPDTSTYDFNTPSPDLEKQLAHYRTKMLEWHGTTRILGRPDPVPLDNIFTDVYIWDKPEAKRHFTIEQLEAAYREGERHQRQKRIEGLTVFEQFKRLFILGKPGAGKTTFMRWVTILAAKGELEGVPIFITLKEMADAKRTIQEQILYQFRLCELPDAEPFTEALLKSEKAIVLFDGLDEVPGENDQQESVIADIRDFVRKYGANHYLITCRTAALTYAFNGFNYVEVADFTPAQIETYITRYFTPDKKQAEACLAELKQERHQKLQELARSPLLLSLFCLNYQQSGTFPAERVDLYEEALLALLTRWNGERNLRPKSGSPYGQMSPKRRTQLYATLSYQNFVRGSVFIKSDSLARDIESFLETMPGISEQAMDGIKVLQDMEAQHGIIVERAQYIHAFSHLTFQEYYTAKYITDNEAIGTLDELMTHTTDRRWREVFLLTANLLSQADTFFALFFERLDELVASFAPLNNLLTYIYERQVSHNPKVITFQHAMQLGTQISADAFYRQSIFDVNFNTLTYGEIAHAINISDATLRLEILGLTLGEKLQRADMILEFIALAISTAKELGMESLRSTLSILDFPNGDATNNPNAQWINFRTQIQDLFSEHLGGIRWGWDDLMSAGNIKVINDYLYATTLLAECLNLAVVTDREGIKNRILLPPSAAPT